jgi:hypothetical protein
MKRGKRREDKMHPTQSVEKVRKNVKARFLPFKEAREFVHSLGIKKRKEWQKWCKSVKKPKDIPSHPYVI